VKTKGYDPKAVVRETELVGPPKKVPTRLVKKAADPKSLMREFEFKTPLKKKTVK
jgi:hypothetical protein